MNQFATISDSLSVLTFDEQQDSTVQTLNKIATQYLQHYQLSMPADLCRFHAMGLRQSQGFDIVCQYWLPTAECKGTVFINHGYYDHTGLFFHLVIFALEQGFAVAAYDLPGHGLSSGPRAGIDNFARYSDVLEDILMAAQPLPKPWHCIAQSTGSAVVMHYLLAQQRSNPFERLVMLAPLIKPHNWQRGIWLYRALRFFVTSIPRHYADNSNDPAFVTFCRNDTLQPSRLATSWVGAMKQWIEEFPQLPKQSYSVLIIQGTNDDTVDWHYNVPAIKEKLPQTEIIYLDKARHHLANESEAIRTQLLTHIRDYLLASNST